MTAESPRESLPSSLPEGDLNGRSWRRMPPTVVWPLLFTLGNLVAGFAAIHYAVKDPAWQGPWGWSGLTMAGAMVFIGMILDSVDGSIARLTRSVSEIGASLDSLADLVTCGVAPAIMMLSLVRGYLGDDGQLTMLGPEADLPWGKVVWGIAAVYVCCAALRLARFNVETQPDRCPNDRLSFHGMPSPGAAGTMAALIILHQHLLAVDSGGAWLGRAYAFGVPGVALLCAIAMVSTIPYDHFVNRYFDRPQSFRFLAGTVIIILLVIWWFQETVAIGFVIYACSGPVRLLAGRMGFLRSAA